jgi:hypothetical protein
MLSTRLRAFELLKAGGFTSSSAEAVLDLLERGGVDLADKEHGQFVVRWVNVNERALPPEADTIIRTVTLTRADYSVAATHWLDGIVPPPPPA